MSRWVSLYGISMMGLLLISVSQAQPDTGKAIYERACIACHGAEGEGALPGVPPLTGADGALQRADHVLMERMINGFQSPGSPMAMPPKGGDPGLTEEDLRAVLEYMRTQFGQ